MIHSHFIITSMLSCVISVMFHSIYGIYNSTLFCEQNANVIKLMKL